MATVPGSLVSATSFLSPSLILAPSRYYGATSQEQENLAALEAYAPGAMGLPTIGTPTGTQYDSSLTPLEAYLARQTGGAIGPENSPSDWTPTEAAAQTDRALARIAQANPELAQQLAEQHGKTAAEHPEEELPWYKDIMQAVGTVIDVTGLDVVFDIMNRPLSAITDVWHDWGKESLWKNIADGLSGHSDYTMKDVLTDRYGLREDSLVTNVLGFAMDVALDPLTYVSLGTGALGRQVVSKTVAKAGVAAKLGEAGNSALRGTLLSHFDDVEKAAQWVVQLGEGGAHAPSFMGRMRDVLKGVQPDMRSGAFLAMQKQAEREGLMQLVHQADTLFKQASTVGWQRTTREAAEKLGVDKNVVDGILGSMVSEGTGLVSRGAYVQGRAAGAALGGARFRFNIPVIGLRAAGLRIPLWPARMDFSTGRRFFAGLSGQVRLSKMVGQGRATMKDMEIAWAEGFKGLAKRSPAVAAELGKGGRSIFYSASEMMGQGTKLLTPHARVLRGGGLGAVYAADVSKFTRHIVEQTREELLVTDVAGKTRNSKETVQRFAEIVTKVPAEKQAGLFESVNTLRSLVPTPGVRAAEYYDTILQGVIMEARRLGKEASPEVTERLRVLRARKQAAEQAEASVTELTGDTEIATMWGQVSDRIEAVKRESGATPTLYDEEDIFINDLNPEDVAGRSDGREWVSPEITTSSDIGVNQVKDMGASGVPIAGLHAGPAQVTSVVSGAPRRLISVEESFELIQDLSDGGALFGMELPEGTLGRKIQDNIAGATDVNDFDEVTKGLSQADKIEVEAALEHLRNKKRGLLGDAVNDPELQGRRVLGSEERIGELGNDESYYYHAVGQDDASSVGGRGIDPRPSLYGMNAEDVAPEMRIPRAFLAKTADDAMDLTRFRDNKVIFRIKREVADALGLRPDTAPGTEGRSWYTTQNIPMDEGDYLGLNDEWLPVKPKPKAAAADPIVGLEKKVSDMELRFGDKSPQATMARIKLREAQDAVAKAGTPVEKLMNELTDETKRIVEEQSRLARLSDEEMAYMKQPTVVQTGPQRNLRIDRSTTRAAGEATKADLVIDPVAEFQDKLRPFLKDLGQGEHVDWDELPEGTEEVIADMLEEGVGLDKQLAEMTTEYFRRQGYTGIEVTHDGGTELVLFFDKGASALPAARVNPFASRVGGGGAPLRTVTGTAREQVLGMKPKKANAIMRRINRAAAKLPPQQAEAEAKRTLSKAGVEIDGDYFERDLLKVLSGAVDDAARETGQMYVGQAARHAENLGMFRGGFGEAPVSLNRYDTIANDAGVRWAAQTAQDVKAAQTRLARLANKAIPKMELDAKRLNQEIMAYERVLDDIGTGPGVIDVQRGADAQHVTVMGKEMTLRQAQVTLKRIQAEAKAAADKLQRSTDDLVQAEAEIQRIKARSTTERAPVLAALVPAQDAMNRAGMAAVRLPGFEDQWMPVFMAEEFESAMRGFPKLEGAHLAFRQFNNWWKQFATWLVPSFHLRNMQGAFFNNWLGGVGINDYVTTGRVRRAAREMRLGDTGKWADMKVISKDPDLIGSMKLGEPTGYMAGKRIEDLTYGDLALLTTDLNLTASNGRAFAEAVVRAEVQAGMAEKGAAQLGKRRYLQRVFKPYTAAMRGTGTLTENVFRTAAWVRGLRDGRSMMESRAFTMMRHGDYEDLTDFEYGVVRDLIPFYKWMRTNTPFQIHQLLESPGKLLAVQKGQRLVYEAQGLDYDEEKHRMPSWMQEGFTIPFGVGETEEGLTTYETVMLDLPMSDLFMGTRDFVSSFLPTVRPLLENYVFEQQTFSGKPLTGELRPMNPLFSPVAPILTAVGMAERGEDGGLYMSDKTENLLGIMPLYVRFKNYIYADDEAVSRRSGQIISATMGVQLRPVDEAALTQAELNFYYDQVLPTMEYLKDIGYPLPTTADLESTIGTTDQILTRLGIEPGPTSQAA